MTRSTTRDATGKSLSSPERECRDVWEAPDACEECEPQVVASRTYCRNCGLTVDPALTGTSGMAGPLWARSVGVAHPVPAR